MAGLLEVAAGIAAGREQASQVGAGIGASKGEAEELANALFAMGVDGRAEQMQQSVAALEEAQAIRAQLEAKLEQAEQQVLAASQGSGSRAGSASSAGAAVVAAASEAPPPEAGGKGGGEDPPKDPPPTPAASVFEPEDFSFDLFGDEIPDDQIIYTVGEAPPNPNEIDTEELTGRTRFDKMRQGLARNAGDLKEAIEKGNYDATELVSDNYDPYTDTSTQTLVPSNPEPVAQAERPIGEADPSIGTVAGPLFAMTVLGVEVTGKIKDAVSRKRD